MKWPILQKIVLVAVYLQEFAEISLCGNHFILHEFIEFLFTFLMGKNRKLSIEWRRIIIMIILCLKMKIWHIEDRPWWDHALFSMPSSESIHRFLPTSPYKEKVLQNRIAFFLFINNKIKYLNFPLFLKASFSMCSENIFSLSSFDKISVTSDRPSFRNVLFASFHDMSGLRI